MKHLKTEQRNPRTRGLDLKSSLGIVRALNHEDATVALAVRRELPSIARAVDAIVASLKKGGTLFYVGAGTSGRLAMLDAAEIPPTFGTSRRVVRALIAGGRRALQGAVEGAEDSTANGAKDLLKAGLTKRDVVVGIAASGTTPYVLGALKAAKNLGVVTVGVTSNRRSPLARLADIAISPNTGPEAVAGSTRMKAGTSQKMVLNLLSTATMVKLGRVYENWMIYLTLTNQKLERRGTRILREATGASASTAAHALRQTGHDLPSALVMLKSGVNASSAKRALATAHGNARLAIESLTRSQHSKKGRG
ncbi:MAG: N-acetylmuramic acid 6-phosphate etherase [Candidatus Acidiferrales bacterium]